MKRSLIILSVLVTAFCIQPQFKDPVAYSPLTVQQLENFRKSPGLYNSTNPGPYGYKSAVLPYHGNIGGNLKNPVIEIKNGLSRTQIQIRVETKVNGASICVIDDVAQDGSESCGKGQIDTCYTPSRDGMKFEFYCTESCDSDNVEFFYRIIKSDIGANDLWCTNMPADDWPSNLLPTPATLPPKKTTPKNKELHGSLANSLQTSTMLLCLLTTLCLLLNFKN